MSKNKFNYTYTAPSDEEKREIYKIRDKYLLDPSGNKKYDELKKLDAKVNGVPKIISITLGVVGVLIFGTGMAMVLEWGCIIGGIIVSSVGIIPLGFANVMYNIVLKKMKDKYGQKIIDLTDELLKDE